MVSQTRTRKYPKSTKSKTTKSKTTKTTKSAKSAKTTKTNSRTRTQFRSERNRIVHEKRLAYFLKKLREQ